MAKTTAADKAAIKGRKEKARQFMTAAADTEASDTHDAYITLLVNAGIAAADVLCGKKLGYYSSSDNHTDAVALLAKVDRDASSALKVLLNIKSKSAYTPTATSGTDRTRVERAAAKLIDLMDRA
jgi:hypothetical protein